MILAQHRRYPQPGQGSGGAALNGTNPRRALDLEGARLAALEQRPQATRMIRIGANSAALVQQTANGTALQFAPTSAVPGAILVLRGVPAFQLPLEPSFCAQN